MSASQELFDALIQATGDLVWDLDLATRELTWHGPMSRSFLGIDDMASSSSFESWSSRLHPDDLERVTASLDAVELDAGAAWREDYRIQRDDGTYADVIARATVLSDERGEPFRMVGTIRDVSRRRIAERRMREAVDYADTIFQSLPGPFYHVGSDLRLIRWNDRFAEVTGYSDDELGQMKSTDVHAPEDYAAVDEAITEVFENGYGSVQAHFLSKDGRRLPYFFSARRFVHQGEVGYVGVAVDMSEQIELQDRLRFAASHDALTGLSNRTLLYAEIDAAIAAADHDGHQVGVLDLDLDRFKIVNDGFGHPYGDLVLQAVASRLQSLVAEIDVVARLGGDEFVILVPAVKVSGEIEEMAQRLVDSFTEPFDVDGRRIHLTGSIGVALYPDHGDSGPALIDNADVAMYYAKDAGRSAFRLFTLHMAEETQRRIEIETRLRGAADLGQLSLAYQPKLDLRSGAVIGCEALLRWSSPELGQVPPVDFIPIAEDSGLIVPIGEWVLEEACRQGRAWLDDGLTPMTMAVNVSSAQLLQPDPVAWVASTLARTGFPAEQLELELTETELAHDIETMIVTVRGIRELGVTVAIDDFGTGYSSLDYLRRFDITSLKIDRSFINGMLHEAGDAAIVRAAVAVGHALGLEVVAEGVETPEELELLRLLQCDHVQGYLVSRPVTAEAFVALLAGRAAHELAPARGASPRTDLPRARRRR